MGVLSISEPSLELLKGELGLSAMDFNTASSADYEFPLRVRCPSTMFMEFQIRTGTTWPAGLRLWTDLGISQGRTNSVGIGKIDAANLSIDRTFKAHFWYEPDTGLVRFKYWCLIAGVWTEDASLGVGGVDPTKVIPAFDLTQEVGSGRPAGIGWHVKKIRVLRGLH